MTENKLTLNADTIVSINLKDKVLLNWWVWKLETTKKWSWKKFKYIKTYKEGFYDEHDWIHTYKKCYNSSQVEMLSKNILIEDKKVYHKPEVVISMLNGKTVSKYFNTYNEALNFSNTLSKKIPNKIEI